MKTKEYLNQPHVKEEIRSRFNYNPDTGQLTWAIRDENIKRNKYFNTTYANLPAGRSRKHYKDNYIGVFIAPEVFGRKMTLVVSRICWLCMTGDWPEHTIDHIDKDGTNNKWENLRDVTQAENNKNKGPYKKHES